MDRRDFLRWTGLSGLTLFTPNLTLWPSASLFAGEGGGASVGAAALGRALVLIELKGGNDGLNTVVPFEDDEYYKLRPRIGVPRDRVLSLSNGLGFHEKLKPLLSAWSDQELAIVRGVGYESPNRSHFRSIEIWETGSDSDEFHQSGWISRLFKQAPLASETTADGVILGGDTGPLMGSHMRNVAFRDPKQFTRQARRVKPVTGSSSNPALEHILGVRNNLREVAKSIEERHAKAPSLRDRFPRSGLGRQLQTAAELLTSKVPVSVIKASLGGFDTHSGQRGPHERLLAELGGAVSAFRDSLKKDGLWDQVTVLTYSEFGRRPAENGSGGTDHGTAAPHFILGGQVKGGMYGQQPSLSKLRNRDLRHHVDYRSLYATIARDWWQMPSQVVREIGHAPLDFIKTGSSKTSAPSKKRATF